MKKTWILSVITLLTTSTMAQLSPGHYFVKFTDKQNTPYSISNPAAFLSQRAIDRRTAHGVSITGEDLPVDPVYVDSLETLGANVLYTLKWFNGAVIESFDTAALDAIWALSFVDEPNSVRNKTNPKTDSFEKLRVTETSASTNETDSPNANVFDYGAALNQVEMMHVESLHNEGYAGEDVHIAVMDAGFAGVDTLTAFTHIYADNRLLGTRDFVSGGEVTYNRHTHGTYVLSCMGANTPGQVVGTAPNASYYLFRTEDGGQENLIEEFNWIAAAEWADSAGVDVFNTSLGYTTYDMSQNSYTTADLDGQTSYISRASNKAANKGILVVNSAGNSGGGSWHYIGMPADADSVLAIGAVNAQRQIVGFSSRGPSADGRLKPNVSAQGEGAAVTSLGNGVTYVNGTSFSSPLTAGAAACLWQKFPGRTNMEIFHAIEYSSHLYFNSNNNYGWGIPDFSDIDFTRTGVESVVGTKGDFDLFPNPANETLAIKPGESFQSGGVDVHVYSSGMEVLTVIGIPKDGTTRFAINDLAAGFYIVELRQSGHSEFATVVVAR